MTAKELCETLSKLPDETEIRVVAADGGANYISGIGYHDGDAWLECQMIPQPPIPSTTQT